MKLPRRGRRSGKGEIIRRWYPLYISARMPKTIEIIEIFISTLRKGVRSYIHN
jgi:hypothetical protein